MVVVGFVVGFVVVVVVVGVGVWGEVRRTWSFEARVRTWSLTMGSCVLSELS